MPVSSPSALAGVRDDPRNRNEAPLVQGGEPCYHKPLILLHFTGPPVPITARTHSTSQNRIEGSLVITSPYYYHPWASASCTGWPWSRSWACNNDDNTAGG
eukprot:6699651-Pyramimonas_sp.AAC.1